MKKTLSMSFSFIFFSLLHSQTIVQPVIWLKAHMRMNNGYELQYFNSGMNFSTPPISEQSKDVDHNSLNNYPYVQLRDSTDVLILTFDSLNVSQKYTAMIAYKADCQMDTFGLWTLKNTTNKHLFLTNREIGNNRKKMSYILQNDGPIVNTSIYNLDKKALRVVSNDTLYIGHADKCTFRGKIAEFIFLKDDATVEEQNRWHSYLCLKYGVTMPMGDYIDSKGDSLWIYNDNKNYSAGIGGIGRDDAFSLYQLRSKIWNDSLQIQIENGNDAFLLSNEQYMLWGHNGKTLALSENKLSINSEVWNIWERIWLMKPFSDVDDATLLTVIISVPDDQNGQNLHLIINSNDNFDYGANNSIRVCAPDSISGNHVWYKNITWDLDRNGFDYFTFAYPDTTDGTVVKMLKSSFSDAKQESSVSKNDFHYHLSPNPTHGEYDLIVDMEKENSVTISVSDVSGRIISSKNLYGKKKYHIRDKIASEGVYYIEIQSTEKTKIIPLVVK